MGISFGAIVANKILSAGSKDFTIGKAQNGLVEVVFAKPFDEAPVVVLTQHFPPGNTNFNEAGGDTRDNSVLVAVDKGHFLVKSGDSGGTARAERAFHFIAIGPGGITPPGLPDGVPNAIKGAFGG